MIPTLCGVIKDGGMFRFSGSGGDDSFQGKIGKFGIHDQLVQVVDISLMVLPVVKPDCLSRDIGLQGVFSIGKGWKGMG